MLEEPLCRRCRQRGLITETTQVDHIVPIDVQPELRLDRSNLQGLCNTCHAIKTAEDQSKYG